MEPILEHSVGVGHSRPCQSMPSYYGEKGSRHFDPAGGTAKRPF
jgi:hypothetical protein